MVRGLGDSRSELVAPGVDLNVSACQIATLGEGCFFGSKFQILEPKLFEGIFARFFQKILMCFGGFFKRYE